MWQNVKKFKRSKTAERQGVSKPSLAAADINAQKLNSEELRSGAAGSCSNSETFIKPSEQGEETRSS